MQELLKSLVLEAMKDKTVNANVSMDARKSAAAIQTARDDPAQRAQSNKSPYSSHASRGISR